MKHTIILGVLAVCFSAHALADNEVIQTGRYTVFKNQISISQTNPLKVVVGTRFPQSVITIEDGVCYLLSRSGYRLADAKELSEEAIVLLGHEIPAVQRTINHITLDRALMMLAGESFDLAVDPVHRRIGFILKDDIASFYTANNPSKRGR